MRVHMDLELGERRGTGPGALSSGANGHTQTPTSYLRHRVDLFCTSLVLGKNSAGRARRPRNAWTPSGYVALYLPALACCEELSVPTVRTGVFANGRHRPKQQCWLGIYH